MMDVAFDILPKPLSYQERMWSYILSEWNFYSRFLTPLQTGSSGDCGIPSSPRLMRWGRGLKKRLEETDQGLSLTFVVKRKIDNRVVGSTRYMNIDKGIRRLEIGTTWYSKVRRDRL